MHNQGLGLRSSANQSPERFGQLGHIDISIGKGYMASHLSAQTANKMHFGSSKLNEPSPPFPSKGSSLADKYAIDKGASRNRSIKKGELFNQISTEVKRNRYALNDSFLSPTSDNPPQYQHQQQHQVHQLQKNQTIDVRLNQSVNVDMKTSREKRSGNSILMGMINQQSTNEVVGNQIHFDDSKQTLVDSKDSREEPNARKTKIKVKGLNDNSEQSSRADLMGQDLMTVVSSGLQNQEINKSDVRH